MTDGACIAMLERLDHVSRLGEVLISDNLFYSAQTNGGASTVTIVGIC